MFRLGLDVNGNRIRAGLDKARRVMIGMFDHEMDVERKICVLAHGRHDGGAKRNIIDKMSIHNVAMNPIGAGCFDTFHFLGQR